MKWTEEATQHGYPVFVLWKWVKMPSKEAEEQGRAVTDIRSLNRKTQDDMYPMPLQEEIIACVRGCSFITTMDGKFFFHQWPVRKEDQHKLTVVSHRGQETYLVASMGYKNSPPFAQRQIDLLTRKYRHFMRAYIDDMAVFSKTVSRFPY